MSNPEHRPIRRLIEALQHVNRHIKPLKKSRGYSNTSKSSNVALEAVSLKTKPQVLLLTEKSTNLTADSIPTITTQKYTKKKSRGL